MKSSPGMPCASPAHALAVPIPAYSLHPCVGTTSGVVTSVPLLVATQSAFLGLAGQPVSPLFSSLCSPMERPPKFVYSVWALPPDDLSPRLRSLMAGLRSEFGGPQFEPHVTVVGAIGLTEDDAVTKFRAACDGLRAYTATVGCVATGTFFYQCVYLLLHPTAEVVETNDHCSAHLGYKRPTPYMPHLSLLYGDLTDEEKKKAQEKANELDGSLNGLSFLISRLALYKTGTEDKTCQSWEKIAECSLNTS